MAPKKKNILFIINPIAGTKSKEKLPSLIYSQLHHHKFDYTIIYSKRPGHAHKLAQKGIIKGYEVIVAVGGDGTVNEVASALMHNPVPMAIIPHGSGNGLARHLGIPMDSKKAIGLLNEMKVRTIDAGLANGNPFFCTTGIGFDAHIGKLFAQAESRGFKTYVNGVLKEFLSYRPLTYSLKVSKEMRSQKAFLITLANAGQWGNNAYISPEADIQDGLLDLCIMKPFRFYHALALAYRMFSRSMHKSNLVQIERVKKVRIESEGADCYHFDGEHRELKGPLKIKSVPACLQVVVA
ncbi:diacylglycerol kinase family lipid kinase [Cytophagales bacterium LB-30]|uniref:Diacylglycerol kinase family lipid kinase n=1 Tax=Shiella aurantiaca TaxID=3058365 RepID=A0ABT8F943_9BACT|nr:diacylglycerol kinase family lipid kinase [Shiella aurantiaca]MDN4166987.1 diacylglycerol kinase family lipid kinase [Shiella aurantiaca]